MSETATERGFVLRDRHTGQYLAKGDWNRLVPELTQAHFFTVRPNWPGHQYADVLDVTRTVAVSLAPADEGEHRPV